MKGKIAVLGLVCILIVNVCTTKTSEDVNASKLLDQAESTFLPALQKLNNSDENPRSMEGKSIRLVGSGDWTSGFFPGILWMMYEYSGDSLWLKSADHYSRNIEAEKFNGGTHDMGFKMYCSFGNGYRLTGNSEYRDILIQSAETLTGRFNPLTGAIRSWDHNSDKWDYPVIIDNMMNLELLFWATAETGDSSFYNIAVSHALTTLNNHFRKDNSSYHVISFDTLTGEVVKKNTHQGYSHESAWARGQAWGLYGYTMVYRETGDAKFLDQAEKIAAFILGHPDLPEDMVPWWDFDAPDIPDEPRDVSAAAIIASALYELSGYSEEKQQYYRISADKIIKSLSQKYLLNSDMDLPFLLDHSVGNYPKNDEIDVPIIYADYYYVEALLRRSLFD